MEERGAKDVRGGAGGLQGAVWPEAADESFIAIGKDDAQRARFAELLGGRFIGPPRLRDSCSSHGILLEAFSQVPGDSLSSPDEEGGDAIMESLGQAARCFRRGVGLAVDFSGLRPRGMFVGTSGCRAAGAAAYLRLFLQLRDTVRGPAVRLARLTASLGIGHPDLDEFLASAGVDSGVIHCVGVGEAFLQALSADGAAVGIGREPRRPDVASQPSVTYQSRSACSHVDPVARLSLVLGHVKEAPLVLAFHESANRRNSLRYCEQLHAPIHPGGPLLPAHGGLATGFLMLPGFVAGGRFDWAAFEAAAAAGVEFLDRVLDLTDCPLPEQQVELLSKRRIGLGCIGWTRAIQELQMLPAASDALAFTRKVWTILREGAYQGSVALAIEKGAFPLFNADRYLRPGGFASSLPPELQRSISKHGIRNGQLLVASPMLDVASGETDVGQASVNSGALAALAIQAPLIDSGSSITHCLPSNAIVSDLALVLVQAWQAGATSLVLLRAG